MRRVLAQLQWLSNQALPQICYDVSSFLSIVPCSTLSDVIRLHKLIRKIKHSRSIEFFPNLGDIASWAIVTFSDALIANCSDGSTQGGYFGFVCESINNYASITSWQALFLVLYQQRQWHELKELTLDSSFVILLKNSQIPKFRRLLLQMSQSAAWDGTTVTTSAEGHEFVPCTLPIY